MPADHAHGDNKLRRNVGMLGLMQDWPLLCHRIIEHAATIHGTQEVVTRSVEGPIHRTNYAEIRDRSLKVSQRLDRDGIKLGDRVATIAWNTWRHLEAWYGIMGIGAICHTVNPRLFPEQIAWIINHAQDRVVMTDITFVPVLEKIADKLPSVERYIVFTDKAHKPTEISSGRPSTKIPRRRCATRPARQVIPRAYCIRIAPTCCTP